MAEDRILGRGMFGNENPNTGWEIGCVIHQIKLINLSLFELGILADVIYNEALSYSLLQNQCYWFVNTICNIVHLLYGGDFQQILPVVVKGIREEIVGQCLQHSRLWKDIKVLKLKENMCLENSTQEEKDFAQWLLDVGHGQGINAEGHHLLPDHMKYGNLLILYWILFIQESLC